jgi:uncharacterized protein (TIGR00255 family)
MRSMTGFGEAVTVVEVDAARVTLRAEVKTVNHKGLDVKVRLPRQLPTAIEPRLVDKVKATLERGRVDVTLEAIFDGAARAVVVDKARVQQVVHALAAAADKLDALPGGAILHPTLTIGDLLRVPGLLEPPETAKDLLEQLTDPATATVEAALADLQKSRLTEGDGLKAELTKRLQTCSGLVEQLATTTATAAADKQTALRARLQALVGEQPVDDPRLTAEVAILAERLDISEELARLRLHLAHFTGLMGQERTGRKLDFLCQELLREANTTGSKCSDAAAAHLVVELKSEIERVREQVQNVE